MKGNDTVFRPITASTSNFWSLLLVIGLFSVSACSPKSVAPAMDSSMDDREMAEAPMPAAKMLSTDKPSPDPRIGLSAGLFDAAEAAWNMELVSNSPPPKDFVGVTNSDLAFKDNLVFQGNYNGIIVWDISNPADPEVVMDYLCPASQSDVSVYGNLMFVSGEGNSGRLDCGSQGVPEPISQDRLRGIRIFDITDIRNPVYVSNVQTCRGSHTHTVLKDPNDNDNVYIYVSGSAGVRPDEEVPGCSAASPSEDPNSALFRIEVIKVPLADPTMAAIVSSPRIFEGLVEPPQHGPAPEDIAAIAEARARGEFVVDVQGQTFVLPSRMVVPMLAEFAKERGNDAPNKADSAAFREALPGIIKARFGAGDDEEESDGPKPGPTQCHDITVYPEIGLAGGACGGYGLLLDISNPAKPVRMDAVADSNFSYWHSATFNNDGTKVLFTDEWGGGGQPKCRATDPMEWGANAIFTLENNKMNFKSYYKMPAAQTSFENCVAHNGSLIPIPGRDVMVQAWYQGGISIFDWTDASNAIEIAYHDRGPSDANQMGAGGSWSVYWYNGALVSSEIARGLDIFKLKPSGFISENEIAAANSVVLDYLNAQGQPTYKWPATFALSGSFVDQLERSRGLSASRIAVVRTALAAAKKATGSARTAALKKLASEVGGQARSSSDGAKVRMLADSLTKLAAM